MYAFDELIGADVTSFRERFGNTVGNVILPVESKEEVTSAFLHDDLFTTGVINPGGRGLVHKKVRSSSPVDSQTPGMTFQFREPVVNHEGPDVVLFEVQTHSNPMPGDAFVVMPTEPRVGLKGHHVERFDITMLAESALRCNEFQLLEFADEPVGSIEELSRKPKTTRLPGAHYLVLAVGIDLSDLGYAPGETVESIFLEDDEADGHRVDPVLVGGLPPLAVP